jgi:SAM-dependent methyltransferase
MTSNPDYPRPFRNPSFSSVTHCRLLLRVDRTLAIQQAIQRAVTPGDCVLDAGCGSGILSFLALRAGASQVIGVDRENVDLARSLAAENGLDRNIRFIEADLGSLQLSEGENRFDVLIAFVYTNHLSVDEERTRLAHALRERFGSPSCKTIPNKIRYSAVACDWPQADAFTELADLKRSIDDLGHRHDLTFNALFESTSAEIQRGRARPALHADYEWSPGGGGSGGYRYQRGLFRVLGPRTELAEVSYDSGGRFEPLPRELAVGIDSPGAFSAVLWSQELWYDDLLIWIAEHMSPLSRPTAAQPGERFKFQLDDAWRRTNVLSLQAR